MTKDEIISMAKKFGLATWHNGLKRWTLEIGLEQFTAEVEAFAAAKEREACAALADRAAAESHSTYEHCISVRDPNSGLVAAGAKEQAKKLSEAIRARGR